MSEIDWPAFARPFVFATVFAMVFAKLTLWRALFSIAELRNSESVQEPGVAASSIHSSSRKY